MRRRGRKAKCIWCGSGRTIGKGIRQTVTLGNRTIRLCRECGRKFTVGRARVQPAHVSDENPHAIEQDHAEPVADSLPGPDMIEEPDDSLDSFRI